jgi:hypothetical protein
VSYVSYVSVFHLHVEERAVQFLSKRLKVTHVTHQTHEPHQQPILTNGGGLRRTLALLDRDVVVFADGSAAMPSVVSRQPFSHTFVVTLALVPLRLIEGRRCTMARIGRLLA